MEQDALLHGEVIVALAVALVSHAHLDGVESGEHVELGQRHVGQAVDIGGVARDDGVEPAAAALAARGHAILMADLAQRLAFLSLKAFAAVFGVRELGGERTAADAGDVGLLDAQHAIDVDRAHARTGSSAAGAAGRGRDVGIRTVVDVEQRALRALEQDGLALAHGVVQHLAGLGHVRLEDAGVRQVLLADLLDRVGVQAVDLLQDGVLLDEGGFDLQAEDLLVHEVLDADALAGHLVLVARADAALGGADLMIAQALLIGAVEILVVRHDDMRVAADLEVLAGNALGLEHGHFLDQHAGVDHHAVADDGNGVLVHDAGGHQVKRQLLVAVDNGMACVVAALITDDVIVFASNEIGDLAFTFVAPLGANQNGAGHVCASFR